MECVEVSWASHDQLRSLLMERKTGKFLHEPNVLKIVERDIAALEYLTLAKRVVLMAHENPAEGSPGAMERVKVRGEFFVDPDSGFLYFTIAPFAKRNN